MRNGDKHNLRSLHFIILFSLFFFVSRGLASAAVPEPQHIVKSTVDNVLAIVTDKNMAGDTFKDKRIDRIMEFMANRFDFWEMSKRTLVQDWKQLSEEQQKKFVILFSRLLEKTYAKKIDSYSSEEVSIKGQEIREDKAVVETVIINKGVETPIVYKMLQKGNDWFVYDVIIEGVSLITNYRSQFQSILAKDKYDGLIKRIEDRLAKDDKTE